VDYSTFERRQFEQPYLFKISNQQSPIADLEHPFAISLIDSFASETIAIGLSKVVNSSSRISSRSAISNRRSPNCNILFQSALSIAFVARTIAKDSAKGCSKLAIGDC
jgi:hypothetical protein